MLACRIILVATVCTIIRKVILLSLIFETESMFLFQFQNFKYQETCTTLHFCSSCLYRFSAVLNTKRRQIIENRAGLKLIINTILLCGRQSFPS